jgi:hypothetical protein
MIIYRSHYDACFDVCGTPVKMRKTGGEIKQADFPHYIEQMLKDNYKNTAFVFDGEIVFDIIKIQTKNSKRSNKKNINNLINPFIHETELKNQTKPDIKKRIKFILCRPY